MIRIEPLYMEQVRTFSKMTKFQIMNLRLLNRVLPKIIAYRLILAQTTGL